MGLPQPDIDQASQSLFSSWGLDEKRIARPNCLTLHRRNRLYSLTCAPHLQNKRVSSFVHENERTFDRKWTYLFLFTFISLSSPLSPFVACDTIIIIGRNPSLIVFYRYFYSLTTVQFTSNFDVWRKRQNFWVCNTCFDRNFCHLQLINVQSVGS